MQGVYANMVIMVIMAINDDADVAHLRTSLLVRAWSEWCGVACQPVCQPVDKMASCLLDLTRKETFGRQLPAFDLSGNKVQGCRLHWVRVDWTAGMYEVSHLANLQIAL